MHKYFELKLCLNNSQNRSYLSSTNLDRNKMAKTADKIELVLKVLLMASLLCCVVLCCVVLCCVVLCVVLCCVVLCVVLQFVLYFGITHEKLIPFSRRGFNFPCVIRKYAKFANFTGLYFLHFTTFPHQTLHCNKL